jgi:hypothetical protein
MEADLWIRFDDLNFKSKILSIRYKKYLKMTANTREEHLYMAKITEQTERF